MASINRTSFGLNFKAAEKANMWEAVWEAHMSTDGDHGERSFRCAGECAKSPKTTGSRFKSDSCHAPTAYCFIIPFKKYFKSTREDKNMTRALPCWRRGGLLNNWPQREAVSEEWEAGGEKRWGATEGKEEKSVQGRREQRRESRVKRGRRGKRKAEKKAGREQTAGLAPRRAGTLAFVQALVCVGRVMIDARLSHHAADVTWNVRSLMRSPVLHTHIHTLPHSQPIESLLNVRRTSKLEDLLCVCA